MSFNLLIYICRTSIFEFFFSHLFTQMNAENLKTWAKLCQMFQSKLVCSQACVIYYDYIYNPKAEKVGMVWKTQRTIGGDSSA